MDKNLSEKMIAFDLSLAEWQEWVEREGMPRYRAMQIYQWIFHKGVMDPGAFVTLSLAERDKLTHAFCWEPLCVDSILHSEDGTQKILVKTRDALLIELVIMPYDNRTTLCLSSQVGCKMGCTFCQTGKMGLKRNLTSGEILAQLLLANQMHSNLSFGLISSDVQRKSLENSCDFFRREWSSTIPEEKSTRRSSEIPENQRNKPKTQVSSVTNVVFMGMGEPLDNYDAVIKACSIMIDPQACNLSKTKVTISTSGLVPEIQRLGQDLPVRLAISLHNADNAERSRLMPINRKYDLEMLKRVLLTYPAPSRYGITFEYVLIEGVNDTLQHAKKLVHFLHGLKAKVNLIPVNPFPGIEMKASNQERIRQFQSYLAERSIPAPVRYSKGKDISSGCGQLAAKRKEEIHMDPRVLHKRRRLSGE